MNDLPRIHLSIVQPANYVHSLGFLDQARYFRHQFRRMGAEVTISQNRLRHDAVNFVFGAHLGFEADLRSRYSCIFVNLEQLGQGGAKVSPDYLKLLSSSAVVDYDNDNIAAYAQHPEDVLVAPFLYAPYLSPADSIELAQRPIDVLFIGSMNDRRREMIRRIESTGLQVSVFDQALYGPERDQFIVQAKAVFNAHYYDSSRFEQARASHCLSLGTPVISERGPNTRPHAAFEDSVLWVDDGDVERYFKTHFGTPAFYAQAHAALQTFQTADPIEAYADLLAFAAGFGKVHQENRPQEPWRPTQVQLGSGRAYMAGWLNIDVLERAQPDLLLDLGQTVQWPIQATTPYGGDIDIAPDSVETLYANNVLEHVHDLPALMGNCLTMLKLGGRFVIEVPHEQSVAAWQDPTHVRAMNEKSWIYYAAWFWYNGWFEHRFNVDHFEYLDEQNQPCARDKAMFMRVALTKIETSAQERTFARMSRPDFALPDDLPAQVQQPSACLAA
jgi:predicted SAM-dependent methyltransferase